MNKYTEHDPDTAGTTQMKRLGIALRNVVVAIAGLTVMTSAALAQGTAGCTVTRYAEPPGGCQRERLMAAGRQRPFVDFFPSARKSARSSWERQALTKFGERFKSWDNAVCKEVECVKGSISGLKRCTFAAYACVRSPKVVSGETSSSTGTDSPYLSAREVRRLQRWLRRDGVRRVKVRGVWRKLVADGSWGEVTRTAVAVWLEREGVNDSNMTDRDVYNAVRKKVRA